MNIDANGDGSVTINDIPELLLALLLLPGDVVLNALLTYLPGVASFLDLGRNDIGGPVSIGLSIALWVLALLIAGVALTALRNFDRNLTAWAGGCFNEVLRQCRVLRRRLTAGMKRHSRRHDDNSVRVEPVMLESAERAMLRCLTNIDDGAVLTLEELAARLGQPLPQVRTLHLRLRELALIEQGQDSYAKRDGLKITTAGQMVLIAS